MLSLAYGSCLVENNPNAEPRWVEWTFHWKNITQQSGLHYSLPRGSCGRRYISTLIDEIKMLIKGHVPSERLIVFSSVILQRENFIKKLRDVVRSLHRRLDLWLDGQFDILVQEARRCDRPFNSNRGKQVNKRHTERVFTRLMLHGRVCSAMRWLTDRIKGSVLKPNETIDTPSGPVKVIDALRSKHPSPSFPHSSSLIKPETTSLPLYLRTLKSLGPTSNMLPACRIQGSAGPGGCDSSH